MLNIAANITKTYSVKVGFYSARTKVNEAIKLLHSHKIFN